MTGRWLWLAVRVTIALAARPWLWPEVVKIGVRLKPDHGFLPPAEYRHFRETAYGLPLVKMPTRDIIHYISWCRRFPKTF